MVTGTWRRAGEDRRHEVRRHLAAFGLAQRMPYAVPAMDPGEPPILRLRAALPELGPVFCAFGRYLSSRVDLLPEAECQVLSTLADGMAPLPPDVVRDLLLQDLQRPLEATCRAFEPLPFACTLAFEDHHAELPDGERVVVRLAHPDLPELLARDLDLLPLLAAAFGPEAANGVWLPAAVEDFAAAVAAAADLPRQAIALAALAQDAAVSGLGLAGPRVVPAASARRVLTFEDLQGVPVEALVPVPQQADGWIAGAAGTDELAIRLCQIWLRQVGFGRVFPCDFGSGDVRVLPGQRIAWTGEAFLALPPGSRENLWEYLVAAAAHDPERACTALIREMDGGPTSDPRRLQNRLRQLVPFRDGGWGARDDLAGYLFLHWRCAAEEGYRPRLHLIAFYRGCVRLAMQSRRLAPGIDPLRAGLERARLAAGVGDVMQLFDRDELKELLGVYTATLLAMPQRLNEILALAAEGRATVKLEMVEPPEERRRRDSSTAAVAALLALVSVVLLAHHLASSVAASWVPWIERTAAVLLGVLGVFLFRRPRRKP